MLTQLLQPVRGQISGAVHRWIASRDPHAARTYSLEGEDMILRQYFGNRTAGCFVDVGAHHPQRFSNTFYFYLRGWRGINIDAAPGSMSAFEAQRPQDVNVEAAIGRGGGELTFYTFDEPAVNTCDPVLAEHRQRVGGHRLIGQHTLPVRSLADVLAEHMPAGANIDFLSVDVEGHDLNVLASNDWRRFRPRLVLAEQLSHAGADTDAIQPFLDGKGYRLMCRTISTSFYEIRDGAERREA